MINPLVSCLCCTYGRPSLLGEAIKCFLDQDYENKELIVLNDQVGVKLVLENCPDNIRIYNMPTRFNSLGEKRDYIKCLGHGDYFCIWDDDDLYTPWRLKSSVNMIKNTGKDIVKSRDALFSTNNDNYEIVQNLFHSQSCISKDYMMKTKYPPISTGEDVMFESGANIESSYGVMPWYIYRWGDCGMNGGVHHLSGISNQKETWDKSLTWKPYNEINGIVKITPKFNRNYWLEIGKYLKDNLSCYSYEWHKRFFLLF